MNKKMKSNATERLASYTRTRNRTGCLRQSYHTVRRWTFKCPHFDDDAIISLCLAYPASEVLQQLALDTIKPITHSRRQIACHYTSTPSLYNLTTCFDSTVDSHLSMSEGNHGKGQTVQPVSTTDSLETESSFFLRSIAALSASTRRARAVMKVETP